MKPQFFNFAKFFSVALLLNACSPDMPNENGSQTDPTDGITNKTFDFSTYREVEITINDAENFSKYDVYAYSDVLSSAGEETYFNELDQLVTEPIFKNDFLDRLLYSGVPVNGVLVHTINVPKYCTKLYFKRKNNLNFSGYTLPIVNGVVNFDFAQSANYDRTTTTTQVTDYLFCVNRSAELFQIDALTGKQTLLSNMPAGSNTCAVDSANKCVYAVGIKSPYPLMKYSIPNNTWTTVNNLGIAGKRLDFNPADGLLYFSDLSQIYTVNPTTGAVSAARAILGLQQDHEGDLAFSSDGTLYLCTYFAVYRLQLNAINKYQSIKISADLSSFHPTGMAIDSKDNIWLSNNPVTYDIVMMNRLTGAWQYKFGKNANNNTNFKRKIEDLASYKAAAIVPVIIDSDGDGVQDQDDAFPQDASKAFELFTPSKNGTATIAFEDLWPSYGDYDFNDVALNYKAVVTLNAQNLAVQVDFICHVKSNGAGYTNGIGIELGKLTPSQIKSVTGPVLTQNYINVSANGTEANQSKAVVILTDAARSLTSERMITIKFMQPVSTKDLGAVPFNPFIIANKVRAKEIHLPYAKPTSLGNNKIVIAGANRDINGNYISDKGMPWAISFINDFKVPKEKVNIASAYNFFVQWANSNGTLYQDWYKDLPGNINADKVQN